MNYALDLGIIIIVALTIFVYYKRGFVRAVLGFGKVILSVIVSSLLGKTMGAFLAEKFFNEKLINSVYNAISGMYEAGSTTFDLSKIAEKIPSSILTLAESSGVDITALSADCAADTAATSERLYEVSTSIALPISTLISNIFGYVIIFAVTYLMLMVAAFILEAITELPIIRSVNHLLGLALGIVCAIIYTIAFVFLAKAIIFYIVVSGDEAVALEIINQTFIFKLFIN